MSRIRLNVGQFGTALFQLTIGKFIENKYTYNGTFKLIYAHRIHSLFSCRLNWTFCFDERYIKIFSQITKVKNFIFSTKQRNFIFSTWQAALNISIGQFNDIAKILCMLYVTRSRVVNLYHRVDIYLYVWLCYRARIRRPYTVHIAHSNPHWWNGLYVPM